MKQTSAAATPTRQGARSPALGDAGVCFDTGQDKPVPYGVLSKSIVLMLASVLRLRTNAAKS